MCNNNLLGYTETKRMYQYSRFIDCIDTFFITTYSFRVMKKSL